MTGPQDQRPGQPAYPPPSGGGRPPGWDRPPGVAQPGGYAEPGEYLQSGGFAQPGGYAPMPGPPAWNQHAQPLGPTGRQRPTGLTILLFLVTFGIWGFVWYYQVHEEMKRHSGEGLGGVLALVIALFFGIVSPFLVSHEVGGLYARTGRQQPVTALTALWFFPGMLILVGPFVWFVRTNNALNEYWAGLGVRETTLV